MYKIMISYLKYADAKLESVPLEVLEASREIFAHVELFVSHSERHNPNNAEHLDVQVLDDDSNESPEYIDVAPYDMYTL